MDENVTITFKNGNIYEGKVHRKAMHGYGKFWWADGAYYQVFTHLHTLCGAKSFLRGISSTVELPVKAR